MTDELFSPPEQLSPRLAWMKKHDVYTELFGDYCEELDAGTGRWSAWIGLRAGCVEFTADTEQDAIDRLAKWHGLKLWNEE